jgi:hypothetical protein
MTATRTKIPGKHLTTTSLHLAITIGLGYTNKVVYEKASQQIQQDKDNFKTTLRFHLQSAEMAIFVDESNKDRKAARRKYGWSKKGTPVNYKGLFNQDIRYTFIGAADCFGFVIPACTTIMHQYKEKEDNKPVDSDRFVEYVEHTLCPSLGNYSRGEPHSVVIMDNCSIHLDVRVRELIEARGAILVYSAAYCPELIPIEPMFHQWKAFLRRHYVDFNIDWYTVHCAALAAITPQQGLNYFRVTSLDYLVHNHPMSEEYHKSLLNTVCVALAAELTEVIIL